MFIDSHIHLSHPSYSTPFLYYSPATHSLSTTMRSNLIEEFRSAKISAVIEPAIELESNERLLDLSREYPDFVFPAVGVHPTRTPQTPWSARKQVEEWSKDKNVIAIGELGLDYHHDRKEQHRLKQKLWFIWQILLADKRNLPVILHIRLADRDAIRILRFFKNKLHGGVCHCFTGDAETARIYTQEFGFLLGIGGYLLQGTETSRALEEAVKETPLEFLVLETDGPYVKPKAPEGISGKQWKKSRNTSLMVSEVAKRIAEIKGIDVEEVEQITTKNVKNHFKI